MSGCLFSILRAAGDSRVCNKRLKLDGSASGGNSDTRRRGLETDIASVIGCKHLKDVHTAKRQAQTLLSRELAERYRHGRAAVLDFRIEIGFWTALHLGVRGPWYQTGAHTCSYEASCKRLKYMYLVPTVR